MLGLILGLKILVACGYFLSLYAFFVEFQLHNKKKYAPLCDLSASISCSKAFTSKYGHMFGVPNSLFGILSYAFLFVLVSSGFYMYSFYFAALSLLGSLYLAYISYFKIKTYCLVCNSIYVVNILLVVFSYLLVRG